MAACDNVETSLSIVQNLLCMVEQFTGIATIDPLTAVLLVVGALITTASVGAFGYVATGAAVDLVSP